MSSNLELIPGRYTKGPYVGGVRYLNPSEGVLYGDAEGKRRANSGFMPLGDGLWACPGWEFAEVAPRTTAQEPYGYLVCSPNGPAKVLHPTREEAEQEALRLVRGYIAVEFTVVPVYLGDPVTKAYTPKPAPTLERM